MRTLIKRLSNRYKLSAQGSVIFERNHVGDHGAAISASASGVLTDKVRFAGDALVFSFNQGSEFIVFACPCSLNRHSSLPIRLIQHPVLIRRLTDPLFKKPGKMLGIFES